MTSDDTRGAIALRCVFTSHAVLAGELYCIIIMFYYTAPLAMMVVIW